MFTLSLTRPVFSVTSWQPFGAVPCTRKTVRMPTNVTAIILQQRYIFMVTFVIVASLHHHHLAWCGCLYSPRYLAHLIIFLLLYRLHGMLWDVINKIINMEWEKILHQFSALMITDFDVTQDKETNNIRWKENLLTSTQ